MAPQPLRPSRVDFHRTGIISVSFFTSVSACQKYSFPIPCTGATHALHTMHVHDTRGSSPTLTIPGPPSTDVREAYALLHWLRLQIGQEIEVINNSNDKLVSGTLQGFRNNAEWNYNNEDGDEGPYTFWIRAGDVVVTHTVDRLQEVEIRLKTSAHNVALTMPDTTHNGVLPIVVETSDNGHGELHVSYDTELITKPLFDLHYELDAAAGLSNERKRATVEVMCRVQILNKLPFALKGTQVCIRDWSLRSETDAAFYYEVVNVLIPKKGDKDKDHSDNDGDQGLGKKEEDDDSIEDFDVDDAKFPLEETTRNALCKLPTFEYLLEDSVSLLPGELLSIGLPSISVDIALVHFMNKSLEMNPSVQITNSSGWILEPGTWAITYPENLICTFHAGLLREGATYHAGLADFQTITVNSGFSVLPVAEEIVSLRVSILHTRLEWIRTLQYEFHNKDKCKHDMVALIKQEMEPGMSKETTARLFDGVGMGEWENGVEPDEVSMDLPRSNVIVSFSLEGEQARTLCVRQKYFSQHHYLVTGEYSSTLLKRLSRSGASKKVVETLREIRRVLRKQRAAEEKRVVLKREAARIKGKMESTDKDDVGENDDKDEGKEDMLAQKWVKKFVEDVERVTERRMLLLEALDKLAEEKFELEEALNVKIEDLRVAISQGSAEGDA